VDTVRNAVVNGTPSLLVKGSGQAACIMSDAVLLKHTSNLAEQKGIYDEKQQALSHFLSADLEMERDNNGSLDYKQLVGRLTLNARQLEVKKTEAKSKTWDSFRKDECAYPLSECDDGSRADGGNALWARASSSDNPKTFLSISARPKARGKLYKTVNFIKMANALSASGSDDGAGRIISDSLAQAMRLEVAADRIVKGSYGMNTSDVCATDFLRKVFEAADTDKCQVFRLRNTVPDALGFKEALLECMLHGICPSENDTEDSFKKKIIYAIRWECAGILKAQLNRTHLQTDKKRKVLKMALVEAIACDNVAAVKALFEDTNVSVDQFDVGLRLHKRRDVLNLQHNKQDEVEKQYLEHAQFWSELLARIKVSKQSAHLSSLKLAVKKKELFGRKSSESKGVLAREPTAEALRLKRCNDKKKRARRNVRKLSDASLDVGVDAHARCPSHMEQHRGVEEEEFNLQLASYEKRLMLLEAVYRHLLRYAQRALHR